MPLVSGRISDDTMMGRVRPIVALLVLCASIAAIWPAAQSRVDALPLRLSDQDFWRMVEDFSEPNGFFDSDNLVSNEDTYQSVIPALTGRARGTAYIGVGPDQNFSYIVALQPRVSFVLDVRRGNLHLHLMYKAIVEMSTNRVEFLSRLFGRKPPVGIDVAAPPASLLAAFRAAPADDAFRDATLAAVIRHLARTHGFRLADGDEAGIGYVYNSFARAGPLLRFVSSRAGNRYPSYEDLQTATDGNGVNHGYLADEVRYGRLRDLHERNLIVPIVGNFAGAKALHAVGAYLKSRQSTVGAFYTSNVERYLFQDGLWDDFIANVATLPQDDNSVFVRSCFDNCSRAGEARAVTLLDSMPELLRDVRAGRVSRYADVLARSRRE